MHTLYLPGALWTDQYALTMSQAFFHHKKHNLMATFHAFIRKPPQGGGYMIAAGQEIFFDWLEKAWRFDSADIALLRRKTTVDPVSGVPKPIFHEDFLEMLSAARMELSVDAMPEGSVAFADEPIYRIRGPLWQGLMVEAALLNTLNSQSAYATLAARLVAAAGGQPVYEFGLRQSLCLGGLESTRGAYIGGIAGTSNMLAEKVYGIPSVGTFAHAFVMVYEDELQAFRDYAQAMPYHGIFLVDTYSTLGGVQNAITVCKELSVPLKGIRLDSGDLAYLSTAARKMLDEAGFETSIIMASHDLQEETILAIKHAGGCIDAWGVGTNLVFPRPSGAVYKLGAVWDGDLTATDVEMVEKSLAGVVSPTLPTARGVMKFSEYGFKATIPGELDVLRYIKKYANGRQYDGDTIVPLIPGGWVEASASGESVLARDVVSVRKTDEALFKTFPKGTPVSQPLKPYFHQGVRCRPLETTEEIRSRVGAELSMLDISVKRLQRPHAYIAGLEETVYRKRKEMIRHHAHRVVGSVL